AETRVTGALASDYSQLRVTRAGVPKWRMGNNLAGNGADDFFLRRDAEGALPDLDVMKVTRTTGRVDFAGDVYAAGVLLGSGGTNASALTTGTVPVLRLGASGTRDTTTFLRGDNTWAVPAGGGGGTGMPTTGGLFTGPVGFGSSGLVVSYTLHVAKAVPLDAVAVIRNTDANGKGLAVSTGNDLNYAFKVQNAAITKDTFKIFGNSITEIGPTPSSVQWPSAGSSGAPAGSYGPTAGGLAARSSLRIYNGPAGDSSNIVMVANAVIDNTYGGGAGGGPNRQNVGIDGASGLGKIRMNLINAGGDAGWRFIANYYEAPQRPSNGGTFATATGGGCTFSVSQTGVVTPGTAVWITRDDGNVDGYVIITIAANGLTGTIAPGDAEPPYGPLTARPILYLTGQAAPDPNRGTLKFGTDSSTTFFGVQYTQPANSTNVAVNSAADYNLLFYPGGVDTASNGFGPYTDIVTNGKARGLRFGTSSNAAKDDVKIALTIYDWSGTGPGQIYVNGPLLCVHGNAGGDRAPFHITPQSGAPSILQDGDEWSTSAGRFCRVGGVTKQYTLT
ncbi:MAG: hypothetical protein H0X04_02700, partial [Chthoniobacterales bacterium]|nr:hypothetical protein [Chthoniobacterales bacterium]